jgi:2-polyprenyl-6-hydroxyphenyl methylase/3-demethylubiquinone-9 3-methyltransferase
VHALEAGDHRDLLALLEALDQLAAVDVEDARGAVGIAGQDRELPALPGAGVHAHALQHDGEQPGGDLLARGDHRVVFAGVVQGGAVAAPGHQLVGLAGHGRDHDRDLVSGVDLALDVTRDIADALDIGNRGSAELHHQASHGGQIPRQWAGRGPSLIASPRAKRRVYIPAGFGHCN